MLRKAKLWLGLVLSAGFLFSTNLQADWELNMPQGVTQISRETYDLHMQILWWCVAIGLVVFGVMLWSIIYHRKSKGAVAATFHESVKMEIVWTVIPFVILFVMAIPATRVLVDTYDTSESDIDILVTGYQWRWEYKYMADEPEDEVSFFSLMSTPRAEIENRLPKNENYLLEVDERLVIPINKKIRFLVTSNDVIHSWWIPDFAVKKDAIPGFINEIWTRVEEPGVFRGQCTELCGRDHGFMPIVVEAVEQEEFDRWMADKRQLAEEERALANNVLTMDEAMTQGEQVYSQNCQACHQANGAGIPPTFPALQNSAIATGPIADHIRIVVNGVAGSSMAAYGRQLNLAELAAVITYERNAWGNDTGDLVQPSDVNAILQDSQ